MFSVRSSWFKTFSFVTSVVFFIGISSCGDIEKAIEEAQGNKPDDGQVRSSLRDVNTLAGDSASRISQLSSDIQSASALADQGDSDQVSSIWIDRILPTANDLITGLEHLNNAEKKIQDNLSKVRMSGDDTSGEFVFVGAVVAVAGLWAFGKFCQRKGEEMKQLKQQEGDALASGDADALRDIKNKQIQVGQDVGNELGKSVMLNGLSSGPGLIGKIGDGLNIVDTANSVTTEISESNKVKAIGSTTSCSSTPDGDAPSSVGCKIFVNEASSVGKMHIVRRIPVGQWDVMGFANDIARIYQNAVNVVEGIKERILKGFIPIGQATADKVKDNEGDSSYTEPGPPLPEEISISVSESASGGYSGAPQDRVIDGSSQLSGYTLSGVSVGLSWEAYTIPDEFQIIYEGRVLYDTGVISGGGSASADATGSSPQVTIRVITPTGGTAWNWSASVSFVAYK